MQKTTTTKVRDLKPGDVIAGESSHELTVRRIEGEYGDVATAARIRIFAEGESMWFHRFGDTTVEVVTPEPSTSTHDVDVRDVVSVEDDNGGYEVVTWTQDGERVVLTRTRWPEVAHEMAAKLHRVLATYDGFADPHLAEMLAQLKSES